MKQGDPFKFRQLIEKQRLLKANNYIKNAIVIPLELCENNVTIDIKTTDKWSLTPGISFGRKVVKTNPEWKYRNKIYLDWVKVFQLILRMD